MYLGYRNLSGIFVKWLGALGHAKRGSNISRFHWFYRSDDRGGILCFHGGDHCSRVRRIVGGDWFGHR